MLKVLPQNKEPKIYFFTAGGKGFSALFVYNLYNGYLRNKSINLMSYHAVQPAATIKRYLVFKNPKMPKRMLQKLEKPLEIFLGKQKIKLVISILESD